VFLGGCLSEVFSSQVFSGLYGVFHSKFSRYPKVSQG
jgi:hypothetical protein